MPHVLAVWANDTIESCVLKLHLQGGNTILPEPLLLGCKYTEHPYLPSYCLQYPLLGDQRFPALTVITPFGEFILIRS